MRGKTRGQLSGNRHDRPTFKLSSEVVPLDLIDQRLTGRKAHFMPRDLHASQFQTLEKPGEALVADVDNSPNGIVIHIRFGLVLGKESEYGRERRMAKRISRKLCRVRLKTRVQAH